MTMEPLLEAICKIFPEAESGKHFFAKQSALLEEQYGFTPENTHFAEGGCSDEINEPEYLLMQNYWGERFKFGGLAGYCHGGKTGLLALSHHVPEIDGKKNLLIVAGPHIGYHDNQWGTCLRPGQNEASASCGSITSIINSGYQTIKDKKTDPLDMQQHKVEQILLPYLKSCDDNDEKPDILGATRYIIKIIDKDLKTITYDLKNDFDGQIALITGIIINTETKNFFAPSIVDILS